MSLLSMLNKNFSLLSDFVRLKIKPLRGGVGLTFARLCRSTTFRVNARDRTIRLIQNGPLNALIPALYPRHSRTERRQKPSRCVARARRNIPSRAEHTNRPRYYGRKQGVLILARTFGTCVTEGVDPWRTTKAERKKSTSEASRTFGIQAAPLVLWNIRYIPKAEWNFWRGHTVSSRRLLRRAYWLDAGEYVRHERM